MISIIIPVYNSAKYINRALESIYNQTYKNFEVIIVNDGSTDKTLDIINKNKNFNKIKIINQKNSGSTAARNKGAEIANGDWLAFLDSDDYWLSNKLDEQLKLANENDFDAVFCNGYYAKDGKEIGLLHQKEKAIKLNGVINKKVEKIFHSSSRYTISFPSCMLIKKKIFSSLGCFNNELYHSGDYDIFLRAFCENYKIGYDNQPLWFYEVGNENSLTKNILDHIRQMENCWDNIFDNYIKKVRPDLYQDFSVTRTFVKSDMIYNLSRSGFYKESFRLLKKQNNRSYMFFKSFLTGVLVSIVKNSFRRP